jgi:hypothetical protein
VGKEAGMRVHFSHAGGITGRVSPRPSGRPPALAVELYSYGKGKLLAHLEGSILRGWMYGYVSFRWYGDGWSIEGNWGWNKTDLFTMMLLLSTQPVEESIGIEWLQTRLKQLELVE